MTTQNADKRALSRMLAGLVFCTLLTGAAAITITGNSLNAAPAASGYSTISTASK